MRGDFLPAHHMNKEHWLIETLTGAVPLGVIKSLLKVNLELTESFKVGCHAARDASRAASSSTKARTLAGRNRDVGYTA